LANNWKLVALFHTRLSPKSDNGSKFMQEVVTAMKEKRHAAFIYCFSFILSII
jgi:hypothetical protein